MKEKKYIKLLLIIISLIFLLQAISPIAIIPIKPILRFLGNTENPLMLLSSGIVGFISLFILSSIFEFLYSFGFKRESILVSKRRIIIQAIISFATFWLTLFSFIMMSVFRVYTLDGTVGTVVLLNIFLFWFFIIKSLTVIPNKDSDIESSQTDDYDIFEKNRITWFSHFIGVTVVNKFNGENGDVIYKQTLLSNFGYALITVIMFLLIRPMKSSLLNVEFHDTIMPIPELADFFKILGLFLFYVLLLGLLYGVGLFLSRGITLYRNSIQIPLPTFSNTPLFTFLIPRSTVTLDLKDIISYKLERRRRVRSHREYLAVVKFNLKNGDFISIKPVMLNPGKFENSLISLLGNEKLIK